MKIMLEFDEAVCEELFNRAVKMGWYVRENPRKRWTDRERREAIKATVMRIVTQG
jgi:hypothetical protein